MDHYTEFISLIHDFIDLFRSLTTVEQQKLDAAVANDLSILEDCMKKEQAYIPIDQCKRTGCDLCEFTQDPVCFKFRSAGCRRIFRIRYKQTR